MTQAKFISYAQNCEDVMLWRALKYVAEGYYIDVGAWSPVEDSVTAAFYERGWRGINIEPNPECIAQLQRQRPRDINLELAVADAEGSATMHLLDNSGLSTLLDAVAAAHAATGMPSRRVEVRVAPLREIWRRHVPAGQAVHFLKVDVEGAEAEVLRSNDWKVNRPWVVVVEATAPMSQQASFIAWEPLLLEAGYRFAYEDGVNRFYVAAEREELLPAFRHPPNYFDNFVTYAQFGAERKAEEAMARAAAEHRRAALAEERAWQAELRAARAEESAWQVETRLAEAERRGAEFRSVRQQAAQAERQAREAAERLREEQERADRLQVRLEAVYASWSWRITAPLRAALDLVLGVRRWRQGRSAGDRQHKAVPPVPQLAVESVAAKPEAADLAPDFLSPRARIVQAELHRLARQDAGRRREAPMPRLAYVTPLPPECSGIADYSAELIPALCDHFQVDVFVQQGRVDAEGVTSRCQVLPATSLPERRADYGTVLYNFGNSHFHTWMADLIAEVPGIVILHDFHLGGLVWSIGDQPGRGAERFEQLYYSHGYCALAESLRQQDHGEAFFRYPCNRVILEHARGVVVHSDEAIGLARRWFGDAAPAEWVRIPLVRSPAERQDRLSARRRLGLPDSAFVVCNFGLLGATKLNHRLVQAWLQSSLAKEPEGLLIFVGDAGASDYARALRSLIASSGVSERIRITGWVSAETFRDYLAAADLAVQLRSHSRGETSATVLDCMNHGLATIVKAHGSMAELPADSVWLLPDLFDNAQLVTALEELRQDAAMRARLGEMARRHVAQEHAPAVCAHLLREAVERLARHASEHESHLRARLRQSGLAAADDASLRFLAERVVTENRSPYRQRQLLLDVTETARAERRTGIERVARALTRAFLESPPEGFRVEPVCLSPAGGRWHYRRASAFVAELLDLPAAAGDRPIDISRGDVLLGLDISGDSFVGASDQGLFERLLAGGVDCRWIVYDLLPLLRPECFPPGADETFGAWLERVARLRGAVCISRSVADSLQAWMRQNHPGRADAFRIQTFPLGSDIFAAAPTRGLPHDAEMLLARFASEPTVLMVGTLEPRKGHLQAIQAFSLLWARGLAANLVVVGRPGWQHLPAELQRSIPELLRTLRTHPESGRRLVWLDAVSDEYLDRLYESASGLLAASVDEGFGLPLIEAAVKGLPILARDIPVFREVAGSGARYFRANSPEELADALAAWVAEGFRPRPDGVVVPATWAQSAAELWRVIASSAEPMERQRTVELVAIDGDNG